MSILEERLQIAETIIRKKSFRENKGLGNEVGYYIFDYPPEEEIFIRERIEYISSRINKNSDGFEIITFDLYEIMIEILESEGFLEQCFKFEKKQGLQRITKAVGNLMQINDDASLIIKYIKDRITENSVVFLTGVGKCYPIIRSHKVLNNLHQAMDDVPVIMFYPGRYDGQELVLFNSIKDDNYYRAFRLA